MEKCRAAQPTEAVPGGKSCLTLLNTAQMEIVHMDGKGLRSVPLSKSKQVQGSLDTGCRWWLDGRIQKDHFKSH